MLVGCLSTAAPPGSRSTSAVEHVALHRAGAVTDERVVEVAADAELRSDRWDPCTRALLASYEPSLRDVLGTALFDHAARCDADAATIAFDTPRRYHGQSHVGFAGTLAGGRLVLQAVIVVQPAEAAFETVTFVAGPMRWSSPHVEAVLDSAYGRARSTVPLTPTLERVLETAIDAEDAHVVVEGDEVSITTEMKQDLARMLALHGALELRSATEPAEQHQLAERGRERGLHAQHRRTE